MVLGIGWLLKFWVWNEHLLLEKDLDKIWWGRRELKEVDGVVGEDWRVADHRRESCRGKFGTHITLAD